MGTKNDAPTLGKDPTANDAVAAAPAPTKTPEQVIAELQAQLAAKDKTIAALAANAGDDIASMTGTAGLNVRPEHGAIPIHPVTGEPVFNALYPTRKTN